VEAAMRSYARHFKEDEGLWGITGLLHDFDYEKWPEKHPIRGSKILRELDYPEEVVVSILGHSTKTGVARDTKMAQALFAVDELCGMVMATAYVRPTHFDGMSPKSVKKNMKKKGFAAGIHREEIEQGIEELGVQKDEHIERVTEALERIKEELGFKSQ